MEKRKERSIASAEETGGNEEEDPVAGPSLPPPAADITVQSNPVNASDGPEQPVAKKSKTMKPLLSFGDDD